MPPPETQPPTTAEEITITMDSVDVDNSKRVGKMVQTMALFLVATSMTLITNTPPSVGSHLHLLLITARTVAIFLSLFMGVGLSMYSIIIPTTPRVVRVQKKVMVIALTFRTIAFILHTSIVLPVVYFGMVWLLFFTIGALIILALQSLQIMMTQ